MGRPPKAVGTPGLILCKRIGDGRWEARVRFRDLDGVSRQIRRVGTTDRAARNALNIAVRDRRHSRGTTIHSELKMSELADLWIAEVQASDTAAGTKQLYTKVVELYVKPALGQLRVRETSVRVIDSAISAVKLRAGAGAARSTRAVLSGILGLAVRHDALLANPVRETSAIGVRTKKGRARALTTDEVNDLTDRLRADERAVNLDLPDLVDWMLFTGCRICEACAARSGRNSEQGQLLDLEAGTWEVNATVVRIRGEGLTIQERTKSEAGWRVLALPPSAVAMVRRRLTESRLRHSSGVIFTSPKARVLRDPSNTPGDLRRVLNSFDCPTCHGSATVPLGGKLVPCPDVGPYGWVTSHTFRRTVATRLDEAGVPPRVVADVLGHANPSMTMDVYFGRSVVSAQAAMVLDR